MVKLDINKKIEIDKEMYILKSKNINYKKRVASAMEIASEAIAEAKKQGGNMSMSFSSGKDSIVMLDICYRVGFRGDLVQFYYSDYENPKMNRIMAEKYADKYNLNLIVLKCYSVTDAWNEVGYFYVVPETDLEKKLARKADYDFRKKALELSKKNNYVLQFIGMRKAESGRRAMTLGNKGLTYYTATRGNVTCCPIGNLTDDDIWCYIFSNNLEYLKCYDYPFKDRRKIRNELNYMCSKKAIFDGIIEQYKDIYPYVFKELKKKYKNVDSYF